MKPKRQSSSHFPKVKDLAKSTFLLTVSSILIVHTGCNSSNTNDNTSQWESSLSEIKSKTVVTTIKEIEKDLFIIANKKAVLKQEDAQFIVQYMDGEVDTLRTEQVELVSEKDTINARSSSNTRTGRICFRLRADDETSSSKTHTKPIDGQDGFGEKKSRRSSFSG